MARHATVVDAKDFPEAVSIAVKLFPGAYTVLAGIKARRPL